MMRQKKTYSWKQHGPPLKGIDYIHVIVLCCAIVNMWIAVYYPACMCVCVCVSPPSSCCPHSRCLPSVLRPVMWSECVLLKKGPRGYPSEPICNHKLRHPPHSALPLNNNHPLPTLDTSHNAKQEAEAPQTLPASHPVSISHHAKPPVYRSAGMHTQGNVFTPTEWGACFAESACLFCAFLHVST